MRITNQIIVQRQLDGLQANIAAIDTAQTQVSSGKRLTAASDDPTAAIGVMSADSALRAITQYQANVNTASDRVNSEDSVLQQLGDVLTRAQQIAVQQGSSTATSQTRAAATAEVQGLLSSALQLANTKFGDEYLFGGQSSTTAPFTDVGNGTSYTSNNSTGQRTIQIADGESMAISHDGDQVFVSTGVLDAIKNLGTALSGNDINAVQTASTSLDSAFSNVQGLVGDVGARGNQLDMTKSHLDAYQLTLQTKKSNLEDVDAATAITELTSRQTAYQAALLAVSKTTGLTLTDYLK
jgi:flagellar hook-associated protein 3 FlgL